MEVRWLALGLAALLFLFEAAVLFCLWYWILKKCKRGILLAVFVAFASTAWMFAFKMFAWNESLAELPQWAMRAAIVIRVIFMIRDLRNKDGRKKPAGVENDKPK